VNHKLPPSLNRFAAELEQAIRRELTPRRDSRLSRVLRARPRLLLGTTVGAAGTGVVVALVLSAAGSPPAFAVTHNRDGSYTVTLRALAAIPAANKQLARMHTRAVIVQASAAECNFIAGGAGARPDVRIDPRGIRHGWTQVIVAVHNGNQVKVASSMSKAAASACAPPCPPGGNGFKAGQARSVPFTQVVPAQALARQAAGSGSSGNAGNSGNSGSGNSGKSGNSGNWTQTAAPATAIVCPGPPPPGGGNSGNSGNAGNSGNSGSGGSGTS
jgi:hypothetical protein